MRRATRVDATVIDAVDDMLRGIDRFQLEELAGESMCADMAHSTGVLNLHCAWNICESNTVWELVRRDERNEGAIASRDEVREARRLGGYSGRRWCEAFVSFDGQHDWLCSCGKSGVGCWAHSCCQMRCHLFDWVSIYLC